MSQSVDVYPNNVLAWHQNNVGGFADDVSVSVSGWSKLGTFSGTTLACTGTPSVDQYIGISTPNKINLSNVSTVKMRAKLSNGTGIADCVAYLKAYNSKVIDNINSTPQVYDFTTTDGSEVTLTLDVSSLNEGYIIVLATRQKTIAIDALWLE